MRAVIADDMHISRNILKRILIEDLHIEVVGSARNGSEAVDLCREHAPELVILDLSMPVLTGMQAARVIFEESLANHIVVVSSQSQHSLKDQLTPLGAYFCMKPYSPRQLARVIEGIFNGDAR